MDLKNCEIETDKDSHGGFLGDGDYYAKIKCTNINYDELVINWNNLPLSEPLNEVTHMVQCDEESCRDMYEKFSIPNITNGYYYFLDRHPDAENKYDDTELNNRSSWNFTLAIIDNDNNTVYYYELDT